MTYTTSAKVPPSPNVQVLAYHENEGADVVLRVPGGVAVLDRHQREELAAYLVKENN